MKAWGVENAAGMLTKQTHRKVFLSEPQCGSLWRVLDCYLSWKWNPAGGKQNVFTSVSVSHKRCRGESMSVKHSTRDGVLGYMGENGNARVSFLSLEECPTIKVRSHHWKIRQRAFSTHNRKFHYWPQWWTHSCLRVGGNKLPLSRFSQRKVTAMKANYSPNLQRTTIKTTHPLHFISSELCWEVICAPIFYSQFNLVCLNVLCSVWWTCTVPGKPATDIRSRGLLLIWSSYCQ